MKLYRKKMYQGKFVALKPDTDIVVGYGRTPEQALRKAHDNGFGEATITRVPVHPCTYVR